MLGRLLYVFLSLSCFRVHAQLPEYWEDVLQEVRKNYPDIYIQYDLKNPSVAASADGDGRVKKITLFGGLLKSEKLTPDTFRLVLCHEIGHIEGGEPKKNVPPESDAPSGPDGLSYMSAEGQADYFATHTCFPKLVKGQNHAKFLQPIKITTRLKRLCQDSLCLRSSVAGYDFLRVVYDFKISFETPDPTIAPVLIRDFYPGRQCRLDTFVNGAIQAERPPCWFR